MSHPTIRIPDQYTVRLVKEEQERRGDKTLAKTARSLILAQVQHLKLEREQNANGGPRTDADNATDAA